MIAQGHFVTHGLTPAQKTVLSLATPVGFRPLEGKTVAATQVPALLEKSVGHHGVVADHYGDRVALSAHGELAVLPGHLHAEGHPHHGHGVRSPHHVDRDDYEEFVRHVAHKYGISHEEARDRLVHHAGLDHTSKEHHRVGAGFWGSVWKGIKHVASSAGQAAWDAFKKDPAGTVEKALAFGKDVAAAVA